MRSLLLILLFSSCCLAQESTVARLEALLPEIGVKGIDERQQAQEQWERIVYPLGHPENTERATVSLAMAEWAKRSRIRTPARIFILRQLERIGGDEVVDSLASLLSDQKQTGISETARRALAANPSPRAGKALIARFGSAEKMPEKRALLNAIGYRAEPASAEFLVTIARTEKGPILVAANAALSKLEFGNGSGGALRRGQDKDAILRRADRLFREGRKRQALAIYRSMAKKLTGKPAGAAAFRGVLESAEEAEVVELVVSALDGDDVHRRQIAMARTRSLSPPATRELAGALSALSTTGQRAMLTALGTQRSNASQVSVIEAMESEDASVRRAAIEAMGNVGDAAGVHLLVDLMHKGDGDGELAKRAVQAMRDPDVDRRLVAIARLEADSTRKARLFDLLNGRRAAMARPLFVEGLSDRSADIQQRCFGALSRLGTAEDVSPMLVALGGLYGGDKDRVEKQLVSMCRRLPEGASPVLEHYDEAELTEQLKLMPLLGRIGDGDSLQTIRNCLADRKRSSAAIAALCNWPNSDVSDDLRALAMKTKDAGEKIRVLRSLARVAVLGGSDSEKLDRLKFVMKSASRDDERNLALDRAKAVRTVESLEFVLPHVDDAELGKRARRTVIDLAHHRGLREANREQFEPALKLVIPMLEDERQLERAKRYLANE